MKVGPLFKHFGSKWSGAKHYPPPLPGLPLFEPFAGGAGYALNYVESHVVIWEDDPHVAALWRWFIAEANENLVRSIPINVPEGTDIRTLGLMDGQALLMKHWQRTNNCGDCWTVSPWGNKPGQWTANTRARVSEEVAAVKHWEFARPTYDVRGTYFIDPPYLFNYRYRFGPDKDFDHEKLSKDIVGIPVGSLVIACEATCPKTGRVPDYLPFGDSHRQVTSRRKPAQNHHSRELVWIRRSSLDLRTS